MEFTSKKEELLCHLMATDHIIDALDEGIICFDIIQDEEAFREHYVKEALRFKQELKKLESEER